MSNFDQQTYEAIIEQKNLVIQGCLVAMRRAVRGLDTRVSGPSVAELLRVEIRELENLQRVGRRNPDNVLEVTR